MNFLFGSKALANVRAALVRYLLLPLLTSLSLLVVTGQVHAASSPSITGNPANRAIVAGADTTFSVTASDATGYQWQVSTDSGNLFNDISSSAPYSGETTTTLTITGATVAMSGYRYRAVASGAVAPAATSYAATLTVQKATPTVTAATSDANPALGDVIVLSATLADGSSPTGGVTFKAGTTTLGTGVVTLDGMASYAVSSWPSACTPSPPNIAAMPTMPR